jgi:hypothetical protein
MSNGNNIVPNELNHTFIYEPINVTYEITRPTIYLSNLLKTSDGFYYLEKRQYNTSIIFPEIDHMTKDNAEAGIVSIADWTHEQSDPTINLPEIVTQLNIQGDNHIHKVMLSNYSNQEESTAKLFMITEKEDDHTLVYKSGITPTTQFVPTAVDTYQYLCPKLNYTTEIKDIIDYTQLTQEHNEIIILTYSDSSSESSIFTNKLFDMTPISSIPTTEGTNYLHIAYQINSEWAVSAGFKNITEFIDVLKSIAGPLNHYIFIKSKREFYDTNINTIPPADSSVCLLYGIYPTSTDLLTFDNVILSEKINNQVIYLSTESSQDVMIYYPDLRSFNHVECMSSLSTSLMLNYDILQLINPISTITISQITNNSLKKITNLYITLNALQGVLEYKPLSETIEKFHLNSFVSGSVYLPKGYKNNAQILKVLDFTGLTVEEFDDLTKF